MTATTATTDRARPLGYTVTAYDDGSVREHIEPAYFMWPAMREPDSYRRRLVELGERASAAIIAESVNLKPWYTHRYRAAAVLDSFTEIVTRARAAWVNGLLVLEDAYAEHAEREARADMAQAKPWTAEEPTTDPEGGI